MWLRVGQILSLDKLSLIWIIKEWMQLFIDFLNATPLSEVLTDFPVSLFAFCC